ncbi:MAG TPA: hypothetical protein VJ952_14005, partial [Opitutales bacterium]|nr:hypothetical protein [Opitutales bacterium]
KLFPGQNTSATPNSKSRAVELPELRCSRRIPRCTLLARQRVNIAQLSGAGSRHGPVACCLICVAM